MQLSVSIYSAFYCLDPIEDPYSLCLSCSGSVFLQGISNKLAVYSQSYPQICEFPINIDRLLSFCYWLGGLFIRLNCETISLFKNSRKRRSKLIDFDGFRPNVGIVICNKLGQVLWAKRFGQNSWQFPQGGINEGENIETAMYRELYEEVGLSRKDVRLLWASKYWLKYKLPKRLVRMENSHPVCIGQKQRWFLLQLVSDESTINLKATKSPEFDGWRWVSFWYPVRQVVSFKRDVYRKVMKEFAQILHAELSKNRDTNVVLDKKEPVNERKPFRKSYRGYKGKRT